MNLESLNYIKGRIANAETSVSGDIITVYKATLDTGETIEGSALRPFDGFDMTEAQQSAFQDAISILYAGVDFILSKK